MKAVALITGGTRGIGLGIARCLAREGMDLMLNGVRAEQEVGWVLDELRRQNIRVEYVQGNIALKADRQLIQDAMMEKYGKINFLVNNAGVAPRVRADILEVEEEDFDHLMDINLKGTFFLTQAIAKWMQELKTSYENELFTIVTVTSVSARLASVNRAAYCMAKSALSMMSQTFAVRLAESDIPVFEIQPGVIETDMTDKVKTVYLERIQKGLTLEPRMGRPEDVGKVIAALLRGDVPYATGQIIAVDGGMTVGRL